MHLATTTKKAAAAAAGLAMVTGLAVVTTGADAQDAPASTVSASRQALVLAPADLVGRDRTFERASRSRTAAAATALQERRAAAAAAAQAVQRKRAADAATAKMAQRRAAARQAVLDKAKRARTARARAAAAARVATSSAATTTTTARASSSSSDAGRGALAEAPSHQGQPYQYGATGPNSFDCSGFTQYLFARQGTRLPRTSREQYAASTKVDKSAKQPGDLIFTYGSSGVYHVGIYAGGGTMWAATKTGDVVRRQTIWTTQYYVGRFR